MKINPLWSSAFSSALLVTSALAVDSPAPDQSGYHLFNPVPTAQLREWHTDFAGPSPYTTDAGHYDLRMDFGYGYTKHGVISAERWDVGITTLKVGLLKNLDFELTVEPYRSIRTTVSLPPAKLSVIQSGFTDISSTVKLNLWGNDGGTTALSVAGSVSFPTADDNMGAGDYTGGPSVEFAAQLPCKFELRIDSGLSFYSDFRNQTQVVFQNLISLSYPFTDHLSAYALFDSNSYTADGRNWDGAAFVGGSYLLCQNAQVHVGMQFGVNGGAYDYHPFIGLNVRF